MDPADSVAGGKALSGGAGIRMMNIAGIKALSAPRTLEASTGLVFDDLGVAVINAPPDQYARVSTAVADTAALRTIEPERYVYAMGVDSSYLRGYRDAVNHLVDTVLGGHDAASGLVAAAQSFDETAISWGLQATNVSNSRFTGKGVRIAVLDTGLDLIHPDFVGRVQADTQSRSFVLDAPSVQDGHGHGTHCAGVACGPFRPSRQPRFSVAPDAELLIGKVLDDSGSGTDSDILAGLQWALASKCDIISMSLGAPVEAADAYSTIFEQVAKQAMTRGCLIIAAAGNDSRRPQTVRAVSHPANCPSIAAVAAVGRDLGVAYFSNAGLNANGGQVDFAGPGVDVVSDWPIPTLYKSESGTSMATPHVAGIAALHAEANPTIRGQQLMAMLSQSAKRLPASSIDVGSGLVQAP